MGLAEEVVKHTVVSYAFNTDQKKKKFLEVTPN